MVPFLASLWSLPLICIRVRPRHLWRGPMLPLLGHSGLIASGKELGNGDENCFRQFRRFGKEIGLTVPLTRWRTTICSSPVLVAFAGRGLGTPGERVRLTDFYARVFAQYGIALCYR